LISIVILLSIVPVTLFIGIIFGLIPYFIRPDLIFGLRVPDYQYFGPVISKMKKENLIYDLSISIILVVFFIILYTYIPPILIELIPMLEIFFMTGVYFYFRSKTQELKNKTISLEQQTRISAFIQTGSTNINPVWYLVPWIELIIFIIIGTIYYPNIPNTFAIHFGPNGKPNAYATKSITSVFLLLIFIAIPLTVLFDLIIFAIGRSRTNANVPNPKKSALQLKGFNSKLFLLLIAINIIVTFTMFLGSLLMWGVIPSAYSFILVLPPLLILPLVLIFAARNGQAGWKMYPNVKDGEDNGAVRDDDKEWIGGLIYRNKNDRSILVPKRYGVGYTFNFGNRWSFLILGIIIGLPIVIIILEVMI
jgi:uncharacterized membrane protein